MSNPPIRIPALVDDTPWQDEEPDEDIEATPPEFRDPDEADKPS